MQLPPSTFTTRAAAVLATLALGAAGGLIAGCGGDDEPSSERLELPGTTATTTFDDTVSDDTVPTTATTTPAGTPATATPAPQASTTPGANGGTAAPGTSTATTPQDTGGHAAPDGDTTPSTGGTQDPECRPGTGPGQPDPQCEPLSGPDAQDEDPR